MMRSNTTTARSSNDANDTIALALKLRTALASANFEAVVETADLIGLQNAMVWSGWTARWTGPAGEVAALGPAKPGYPLMPSLRDNPKPACFLALRQEIRRRVWACGFFFYTVTRQPEDTPSCCFIAVHRKEDVVCNPTDGDPPVFLLSCPTAEDLFHWPLLHLSVKHARLLEAAVTTAQTTCTPASQQATFRRRLPVGCGYIPGRELRFTVGGLVSQGAPGDDNRTPSATLLNLLKEVSPQQAERDAAEHAETKKKTQKKNVKKSQPTHEDGGALSSLEQHRALQLTLWTQCPRFVLPPAVASHRIQLPITVHADYTFVNGKTVRFVAVIHWMDDPSWGSGLQLVQLLRRCAPPASPSSSAPKATKKHHKTTGQAPFAADSMAMNDAKYGDPQQFVSLDSAWVYCTQRPEGYYAAAAANSSKQPRKRKRYDSTCSSCIHCLSDYKQGERLDTLHVWKWRTATGVGSVQQDIVLSELLHPYGPGFLNPAGATCSALDRDIWVLQALDDPTIADFRRHPAVDCWFPSAATVETQEAGDEEVSLLNSSFARSEAGDLWHANVRERKDAVDAGRHNVCNPRLWVPLDKQNATYLSVCVDNDVRGNNAVTRPQPAPHRRQPIQAQHSLPDREEDDDSSVSRPRKKQRSGSEPPSAGVAAAVVEPPFAPSRSNRQGSTKSAAGTADKLPHDRE